MGTEMRDIDAEVNKLVLDSVDYLKKRLSSMDDYDRTITAIQIIQPLILAAVARSREAKPEWPTEIPNREQQ
jgi:hypothetical protein